MDSQQVGRLNRQKELCECERFDFPVRPPLTILSKKVKLAIDLEQQNASIAGC